MNKRIFGIRIKAWLSVLITLALVVGVTIGVLTSPVFKIIFGIILGIVGISLTLYVFAWVFDGIMK